MRLDLTGRLLPRNELRLYREKVKAARLDESTSPAQLILQDVWLEIAD